MAIAEIIQLDVEQVQESLIQRSDIYNGKRVIIKAIPYLKMLIVYIKGFETMEFPLNIDPKIVTKIIEKNIS